MPTSTLNTSLKEHIHDHNMAYLMLARELLRHDFTLGILQLGIEKEIAQLLLEMPIPHIIELSHVSQLLCTFALNRSELLEWHQRPAPFDDIIKAQRALHLINPVRPKSKRSSRHTKK
ncbi:Flagellar transcriptional regulator FlhD [Halomonadaceae bacterium LMG 33818]|uniref:flagellar transcriptional regulator FlhD n=1 Tax=Cernens ardua TaxID=3402176 RepID=UPI003EDBA2A9